MHDEPPNEAAPGQRGLRPKAVRAARQGVILSKALAGYIRLALAAFWRVAKPALRTALQIVLALLILLEEWGWRPLAELLGRLARWQPWARLETAIARLPPYAALVVFVVPSLFLLPLKFLAVVLIAKGYFLLAGLLFAGAKVVATALVARLFMLTQPALMQIRWFAWGYDTIMPWKDALAERVRASLVWRVGRLWKEQAKRALAAAWRPWRPTMLQVRNAVLAATARLRAQLRRWIHDIRNGRARSER
jgi:hypothetical protein